MAQITVKELFEQCKIVIKKGYGDRKIVISDDTEGNGYHGLYFGFTQITEEDKEFYQIYDAEETDINKVLILG